MNIYGNSAIFPGVGVDGQDIPPTPGTSVMRVNPTSGKLQLSNNGGGFLDVNSGNSGKSVVAGTNIIVGSDASSNWVVSTTPTPTFQTVTTTTGATLAGNTIMGNVTVGGSLAGTGNISTSGVVSSGSSIQAPYITNTNSTNTANEVQSILTTSGTLDPAFQVAASRGAVTNSTDSIVGRIGLFYASSTPNAYTASHRGSGTNNGYMSFATSDTTRILIDGAGVINAYPRNQTIMTLYDSTLAGTSTTRVIYIGKEASANNNATITYNHVSSGSSSNYLSFGMNGAANTLCLSTNGYVGVRNTAPTVALDVTGAAKFSSISSVPLINGDVTFAPAGSTPTNAAYAFLNATTGSTASFTLNPWSDGRCFFNFFGSGAHTWRSRINSTDLTTFMSIDNNGVELSYLRLNATSNSVAGALRYSGNNIQYYDSGAWKSLAVSGSTSFTDVTVSGNVIFPNVTSKILGNINGISGTPILTVNTNNVTHDYFLPGPNASIAVNGSIRKVNATADIVDGGNYYPLRPFTGSVTVSWSAGSGYTTNVVTKYGSGINFAFSGALLRATFDNYNNANMTAMTNVTYSNVSTSFGNISVSGTAASDGITFAPYKGGAVGSWSELGAFTLVFTYNIC